MINKPHLQWQINLNSHEKKLSYSFKRWTLLSGLLALLLIPLLIFVMRNKPFNIFNQETLLLVGLFFFGAYAIFKTIFSITYDTKAGSHIIWLDKYSLYYKRGHLFEEHYYADILQIASNDSGDLNIQVEDEKDKPVKNISIPLTAFMHSSLEKEEFLKKILEKVEGKKR